MSTYSANSKVQFALLKWLNFTYLFTTEYSSRQKLLDSYLESSTRITRVTRHSPTRLFLIIFDLIIWLNGYFTLPPLLIRHPGRPLPPTVVICHVQRPWAQARKPLGWSVCRRRCLELTPGARKTSITSLSAIFSSLGSHRQRETGRQGHLSPSSTHAS